MRLAHVDALRGFALLGILFVNATWFSGVAVSAPGGRVDGAVTWLIHVFVDSKFYSLFALLFGVGFALQMARAGVVARFRRRLCVLLSVGVVHALIWFGDIISLYAVVGFVLPCFACAKPRVLLGCALVALVAPIVQAVLVVAIVGSSVGADPGHGPAELLPAFATGTIAEVLEANAAFLRERWVLALYSGRLFKLLGLFLLGTWLVRTGVIVRPGEHRWFWRRALVWGLAVGIPTNVAVVTLLGHVPERPPSWLGCLRIALAAIAVPALALGYASAVVVAWNLGARRVLHALANAGRMTLTFYLAQTLVGVTVFYGVGLGLWGRFGAATAASLVLGYSLLQLVVADLWLRRFGSGPFEGLIRAKPRARVAASVGYRPGHATSDLERRDDRRE